MNWRALVLSGVFAAGLTLSVVPRAVAEHNHHYDDDDDGDCNHDRRSGYQGGGYYGRGDAYGQCSQIIDRIRNDRRNIAEIDPRQHPRARQWYIDDARNAERDLNNCRNQARGGDPYYDNRRSSNSTFYPSGGDSYDNAYVNGSLNWKRDWPLLLGQVLIGQ